MIYSRACAHAIRALAYLAQQPEGTWCHLEEIARAVEIPQASSGKILGDLVKEGLLRSATGSTGGYALDRPPEEISLYQIKDAVDGNADFAECIAGWGRCPSSKSQCPVHARWRSVRRGIRTFFRETTLADLACTGNEEARDREP